MTTRFSSSGLRSQYQVPPMSSVGGPSATQQPPFAQPSRHHQRENGPAWASRVASSSPATAATDSREKAAVVMIHRLIRSVFTVMSSTTSRPDHRSQQPP